MSFSLSNFTFKLVHLAQILIFTFSIVSFAQLKSKEKYNLMPWPKEINENNQLYKIDEQFTIAINNKESERILNGISSFLTRLAGKTGVFIDEKYDFNSQFNPSASLQINFERIGEVKLYEDESYQLQVTAKQVVLSAQTDIGILRGLETLLQLVSNHVDYYYFPGVDIKDTPRFAWRGLLIDVSRHYEPLAVLKRNLDVMVAVKMNVFHWHLTDDQGFRVEVKSLPKFQELATDGQFYTQNEIKEIVHYANNLGIRVVPEFDIPGHATSWVVAYPEIASKKTKYKLERYAGIFNPTLDPTNDKTYEIIDIVFTEMALLFPDVYFHIGGDENEGKHWDSNPEIQAFMLKKGFKTNHELQTYFNLKIQKILQKNNKIMMGWDEIFQPNLPKNVVIHSWRGKKAMIKAARLGYKSVLSNGYYIDLLLPASKHYLNDPLEDNTGLSLSESKNILGGEATMWSELVTPLTIDSRIWPRTAAIAERLWSDKSVRDVKNMYKRLNVISHQLEQLGITHIKNKEVILRNISDNQDITALKDLMNICEPLKGYTRNKGGTEYKSFSPFTLFADACTADAPDALSFNYNVDSFLLQKDEQSLKCIKKYLYKWKTNYNKLNQIDVNPKIKPLLLSSKYLSQIANSLLLSINSNKLDKETLNEINAMLIELKKPFADVEIQIVNSLERLTQFYKNKTN